MLVDDDKALVGLVEVTIGLLPAGGGTQRLPRLIGVEAALALMLEGRRLRPAEALACGAVDQVVPRERLIDAARAWVLRASAGGAAVGRAGLSRAGRSRASTGRAARAELVARTRGRYPGAAGLVRCGARRHRPADRRRAAHRVDATRRVLLPSAVARNLMRSGFVHRHLARRYAGEAGPYVQRLRSRLRAGSGGAAGRRRGAAALLEQAAHGADWSSMPWPATQAGQRIATREQPTVGELTQRLLHAVALEGVRCLDDGTVEGAAEADVGSIVGIGFPRWTGGVLSYVETVGLARFVAEAERLALRHGARFAPPPSLVERARSGRKFYDAAPTLSQRSP